MRQHLIALAVAIQFLGACSQESSGPDQAEIRKILEDRVDRYGKSVGIVVGTINSQGRQVVSYGKLDHGSGKRVDGDTLFEIGSITSNFLEPRLSPHP